MNLISRTVPVHANFGGVPRCRSGAVGKQGRKAAVFEETGLPVTCRKCLLMGQGDWVPNPRGRRGKGAEGSEAA